MASFDPLTASLRISLLGPLDVRCDGAPLGPLRSRKGQWLLALLALRQGRAVRRDWLAGTLWPDSSESDALYSLRRSLADLRQAMGNQAACITAPSTPMLCLQTEDVYVDVVAFDAAVNRGDRSSLEQALALYRGPLLEGGTEEWILQERTLREKALTQAQETLAMQLIQCGETPQAIVHLQRLLAIDPFHEGAVRQLMLAHVETGNYAEAVQVYREARLRLRAQLNSDPDPETAALYKRLRADVRRRMADVRTDMPDNRPPPDAATESHWPDDEPDRDADSDRDAELDRQVQFAADGRKLESETRLAASAEPRLAERPNNLPRQITSFIGREREILAVLALMQTTRLITLTGTGGVGKTRLALAVAEAAVANFVDGVCLIELAGVPLAVDVPSAVALALGLKAGSDADLQTAIFEALGPQQVLLLLDNFEQVVEAAPFVAGLLKRCARVTCLVTSRQLLQIAGEHEFSVEPLPLPAPGCDPAMMEASSCVRLFLDRARAARPDFRLDDSNIQAVGEVCRRLDGLPLAVELTAALLRGLTPQQVLPRLKDRFRLLTSTQRDLTSRQRSLRGAIDWSYDLLSDEERRLFVELSVFAGNFSVEAAEQVCNAENILDGLLALRDRSLLKTMEIDGELRYAMLETLREYALEKRVGELATGSVSARHARYYGELAQGLGDSVWSGDAESASAGKAFERDLPNIRAGMDEMIARSEHSGAVDYGIALFRFLFTRGLYEEAEARLIAAERSARALDDATAIAGLLHRRGMIAWDRSEYARAKTLFTESYALSETNNDRMQMLRTLPNLGNVAWAQSDFVAARTIWQEALALAIESEQTEEEAALQGNLAVLAIDQGDYVQAQTCIAAALALYRGNGDLRGVAYALCYYCELYTWQERLQEALTHVNEAHSLFTTVGDGQGMAWSLGLTGQVLLQLGKLDAARSAAL